jgi:hypothetical protein
MVDTLLHSAAGHTRLYVLADDRGNAYAERLAGSLEMSERDQNGEAETNRKDISDVSHWPCATGYALWSIEKPRLSMPLYGQAVL